MMNNRESLLNTKSNLNIENIINNFEDFKIQTIFIQMQELEGLKEYENLSFNQKLALASYEYKYLKMISLINNMVSGFIKLEKLYSRVRIPIY